LLTCYGTGPSSGNIGGLWTGVPSLNSSSVKSVTWYHSVSANTFTPAGCALLPAFKPNQYADFSAEL
jgi:hypothetical protein